MKPELQTINGMWIGKNLSNMEILTIKSFIDHGHSFVLWAYDQIDIEPLDGLRIEDASQILSKDFVFSYKNKNNFGHGKGSYAGFSDIFRYKLLYERGGWWVDMDVTCLRPFKFDEPYVFRAHHELDVVGNVMKCTKGAQVMKDSFEQALKEVNEDNTDWHKPIEILNTHIRKHSLSQFIRKDLSCDDDWRIVSMFIKGSKHEIDEAFYFVHWLNEEWRARRLTKGLFRFKSELGKLMIKHNVSTPSKNSYDQWLNYLKTSAFYGNLRLLNVVD